MAFQGFGSTACDEVDRAALFVLFHVSSAFGQSFCADDGHYWPKPAGGCGAAVELRADSTLQCVRPDGVQDPSIDVAACWNAGGLWASLAPRQSPPTAISPTVAGADARTVCRSALGLGAEPSAEAPSVSRVDWATEATRRGYTPASCQKLVAGNALTSPLPPVAPTPAAAAPVVSPLVASIQALLSALGFEERSAPRPPKPLPPIRRRSASRRMANRPRPCAPSSRKPSPSAAAAHAHRPGIPNGEASRSRHRVRLLHREERRHHQPACRQWLRRVPVAAQGSRRGQCAVDRGEQGRRPRPPCAPSNHRIIFSSCGPSLA